jgi:ParB family chromosome partitioning protein
MPPRKKKPQSRSVGLDAVEVGADKPPGPVARLADRVVDAGGATLATYREPLGGNWVILASLPIDRVEPTPYQRELSEAHVKRLEAVIPKVGRFLDPVIAVPQDGGYWTPNGMHRLEAMRKLGAKAIVALLLPEPEIAFRILALNTEKAHNLKDKSLEVVRMARALAADPASAKKPERDWAFEFEEPSYLTIGLCYEANGRFSGGAYQPAVKRCEAFLDMPIAKAEAVRKARADKLLELDAAVNEAVKALKAAGLQSTYLKPFVVARINPLRFAKVKPGAPPADFDETIDKMIDKAGTFDATKVKPQDLAAAAAMGGGASE